MPIRVRYWFIGKIYKEQPKRNPPIGGNLLSHSSGLGWYEEHLLAKGSITLDVIPRDKPLAGDRGGYPLDITMEDGVLVAPRRCIDALVRLDIRMSNLEVGSLEGHDATWRVVVITHPETRGIGLGVIDLESKH